MGSQTACKYVDPYKFTRTRQRFGAKLKAAICEAVLNAADPKLTRIMLEAHGISESEVNQWLRCYVAAGSTALRITKASVS